MEVKKAGLVRGKAGSRRSLKSQIKGDRKVLLHRVQSPKVCVSPPKVPLISTHIRRGGNFEVLILKNGSSLIGVMHGEVQLDIGSVQEFATGKVNQK